MTECYCGQPSWQSFTGTEWCGGCGETVTDCWCPPEPPMWQPRPVKTVELTGEVL